MSLISVDLYQSATDPSKFLALPAGADPAELMGPMTFDSDYAEVRSYQEGFEFDPQTHTGSGSHASVNAAKIAADLLTVKWAMYRREG